MLRRVLLCAAAVGLLAAACGDDDDSSTDTTAAASTTAAGGDTTAAPSTTAGTDTTAAPTTEAGSGATTTAGGTATSTAAGGAELGLASGDLGEFLVDADGNTLYLFMPDGGTGESTCVDDCEANWPPLEGPGTAGEGVDSALLGTTTRADGSTQVTYNGWPLYYFIGDAAPGDVNGQGVLDVWFVVGADGAGIS